MRKRTVVVSLSALAAAAGLAGGAYAASQPDSHSHKGVSCGSERALISDAARRLHVTPTRLTDALKQALVDQIDAAVAAGRLPRAQAKALKRQIEQTSGLRFGLGLSGPGVIGAQVVPAPGFPRQKAIRAPEMRILRARKMQIQVRAGRAPCIAGALALAPGPVLHTSIAPARR